MKLDLTKIEWKSKTIDYLKLGKYPSWIHGVYAFEKMPMFLPVKLLYSHIYYVLGKKNIYKNH